MTTVAAYKMNPKEDEIGVRHPAPGPPMLLAFIPPGAFGVAVVALLVIIAVIAAAVGMA